MIEYAIYINGTRSSNFMKTAASAVNKLLQMRNEMLDNANLKVSELSENSFAVFDTVSKKIYCYAVGER